MNLADPSVEPTDEQLEGLMKRAFADVTQRHQAALARLRAEIAAARTAALARLDQRYRREGGA